jgi:hypothetical protein
MEPRAAVLLLRPRLLLSRSQLHVPSANTKQHQWPFCTACCAPRPPSAPLRSPRPTEPPPPTARPSGQRCYRVGRAVEPAMAFGGMRGIAEATSRHALDCRPCRATPGSLPSTHLSGALFNGRPLLGLMSAGVGCGI